MIQQRLPRAVLTSLTVLALAGSSVPAANAAPPSNDNFASAATINLSALPFSATVNITEATTEGFEPFYCSYSTQTIWYRLTPATQVWLQTSGSASFGASVSVYRDTGSGLPGLSIIGCTYFNGSLLFLAQTGVTYYIQASAACCGYSGSLTVSVAQVPPPVPVANFYYYPGDPSIFDTVNFSDSSYDPGQQGIASWAWAFGDGATGTGSYPSHRYGADGDYSVHLTVTTTDGRSADTTRVVSVRTHDVAIARFKVPESAAAGQTRQISVEVRNTRYPESVRIQLSKSVPGGYYDYVTVGTLDLAVPVRQSNRTTGFDFSYTFTPEDAIIGKVTFKAEATLDTAHDALPADNVAISSPVRVNQNGPAAAGSERQEAVSEARLAILGVTPNPSRAGTDLVVRLSLPADGAATLRVLDIAGRMITERDLTSPGRGTHEWRVAWAQRPAPGMYWVRLTQGGRTVSARVVLE